MAFGAAGSGWVTAICVASLVAALIDGAPAPTIVLPSASTPKAESVPVALAGSVKTNPCPAAT